MPRAAGTSDRALITTTSADSASRWTIRRPSGVVRSSGRLRFPRFKAMKARFSPGANSSMYLQGSPHGGSTLITSAPMSASSMPANGPAYIWLNSKTVRPVNGPDMLLLPAARLLPRILTQRRVPRTGSPASGNGVGARRYHLTWDTVPGFPPARE